jgi:hypothetical protein
MKSLIVALSAVPLLAGFAASATAAPGKHVSHRVTHFERAAIARSASNLAQVMRRAWAVGRLTIAERMRIGVAQARHRAVVARAHR